MARLAVTEKLAADSSPQSLPSLSSFEANGGKLPKQLKLGLVLLFGSLRFGRTTGPSHKAKAAEHD